MYAAASSAATPSSLRRAASRNWPSVFSDWPSASDAIPLLSSALQLLVPPTLVGVGLRETPAPRGACPVPSDEPAGTRDDRRAFVDTYSTGAEDGGRAAASR
jgi:hypothetical protein